MRIINIGTGTKTDELPLPREGRLTGYVPGPIRMLVSLMKTFVEAAVNSENTANQMRTLAKTGEAIRFERYSANNGVCFIKLDNYKALDKVTKLTRDYLNGNAVRTSLQTLGTEIAREYLQNRRPETAAKSVPHKSQTGFRPDASTPRTSHTNSTAPITGDLTSHTAASQSLDNALPRDTSAKANSSSLESMNSTQTINAPPNSFTQTSTAQSVPYWMDAGHPATNTSMSNSEAMVRQGLTSA